MKKKQWAICKILCVLCCYFFVVSCNKTDTTPENFIVTDEKPMASMAAAAVVVPMKLDKETYSSSFNKYSYDAAGRCIRIDMGQSYITYSYRGNTVIGTTGYTDPTKAKIVRTYTLNSLGLAATCTYTIGTKNHIIEYVYNSNRQVTKITHKSKLNTRSVYSTDDTNIYVYNLNEIDSLKKADIISNYIKQSCSGGDVNGHDFTNFVYKNNYYFFSNCTNCKSLLFENECSKFKTRFDLFVKKIGGISLKW